MKQSNLHYAVWFSKRVLVGVILHAIVLWSVALAFQPSARNHGILALVAYGFAFLIPAYLMGKHAVHCELRALKNGESWRLAVLCALVAVLIAALVTVLTNMLVSKVAESKGFGGSLPDLVTFVTIWLVCAVIFLVPIRIVLWWANRRSVNALDVEITETFS